MKRDRVTNYYSGRVQGVGFRYAAKSTACGFEIAGLVRNLDDGRVELVAEGERPELEAFLDAIRQSEVGHFIRNEAPTWSEATNQYRGFEITH